ncbi:alpha/beta hydrolase [Lentzea sp.]|uniref:alpha/beta hydrolase n=1 Tax=Lentzea sp. TaxID=56099 RepID=UPI002BB5532E|nr:alpha/beta hydrolase [Lentzea sp.]HUQ56228.1 alpha/beta hydrolase [Lentzea sp.]
MPVHPLIAAKFPLLDGITSFEALITDPALRDRFAEFSRTPAGGPPPEVPWQSVSVDGPHGPVPARIYRQDHGDDQPCLVWLHGGAFRMGDLEMPEADWVARELVTRTGAVVVSVDYRLATGGVCYPVPHDDVVAVLRWVRDQADDLGVTSICAGGASAGGNLAAGAALKVRDEDDWQPRGLALVYPVLHPRLPPAPASLTARMAEVPALLHFPPDEVRRITENYLGGPVSRADGYAMPGLAELEGLCRTLVLTAEYDDLRGSGQVFAGQLAESGVDVRHVQVESMLHGFLNLSSALEPVGRALDLIASVVLPDGGEK